eukprot:scaffold23850_cov117-Cylindrotheca_fusiformis.AAC.3
MEAKDEATGDSWFGVCSQKGYMWTLEPCCSYADNSGTHNSTLRVAKVLLSLTMSTAYIG